MSNAPEDFAKLQRLLKLKRYEQPPPGYFNNFSGRVVIRIERENAAGDQAWREASWIRKLLLVLETNPFAAGAFGVSICSLLISGIAYSGYRAASDYSSVANISFDVADNAAAAPAAWTKSVRTDSIAPSINPMFSTNVPGTLFGMDQLSVQKVNFTVPQ